MTDWPATRPLWLGMTTLLLLVAGFGGWAATARISGAVIASGVVMVEQNRQIVQHSDGGLVADIHVTEGHAVIAGQVLIQLDAQDLHANLSVVEAQLLELLARRARLEAERDGARTPAFESLLDEIHPDLAESLKIGQLNLFEARAESESRRISQLHLRMSQITAQIEGIAAQQAALETQLVLISQERTNQQSLLDRGLAQASIVLNLQRETARLQGQSGELTASVAQAYERITEIKLQILSQTSARREEAIAQLRDLQTLEFELRERRMAMLRQLDRLDLRAPVSGVVYGLTVFGKGAVISPAEPLMFIVPQDRPLVISARVSPSDIDKITVGQGVSLRLPALDQSNTPQLFGTVGMVSADTFTDESTRGIFYRAEITLNDGELTRLPRGTSLIPGMPVETYFRTADHSPATYLVRPLWDYFARTFREG